MPASSRAPTKVSGARNTRGKNPGSPTCPTRHSNPKNPGAAPNNNSRRRTGPEVADHGSAPVRDKYPVQTYYLAATPSVEPATNHLELPTGARQRLIQANRAVRVLGAKTRVARRGQRR